MKSLFASFSLTAAYCLTASAQVVSPQNPIVRQGESLQFTADRPVQWSLVSGSTGSIDQTGIYHAPATVKAPASIAGCQIGAPDSVFNTRIDNLPVQLSSFIWMALLPSPTIGLSPSWGVNVADHTTPSQLLNFNYTPGYNTQPFKIPAWPYLKRENGVFSDPLSGVDRHILTVDRETCREYDIYNNYPAGTAGSNPPANAFTAQSGWQYPSMSYTLPVDGATDASGMALAPTTLTLDDIRSGVIRHAMRVTFSNGYIGPSFLWPATTHAGAYGVVPYGSRLRLKSNFDLSAFSATARIILTALKQYGMIVSDGGSNWDIITATDITEDRSIHAAILEIAANSWRIASSQIDIVDESSLMVSASSSRIAHNNPYVTPPAFAIVKADDGVHSPVLIPVALQGVAMNSPEGGGVWIQSGVSKTLNVFVGGTSNTAVTWSMNPALGALNSASGLYLAPSVSAPATTSITATSVADPAVSVSFPLTILPAGPIRISVGDATGNPSAPNTHAPDYGPDSQGHMWWRDQAGERGIGVKNDYWYGPNYGFPAPWPAITDINLYQTQYYNFGDTVYRFVVPNGNYDIDYYVAQGSCFPTTTIDPLAYREHLEAQGQIGAHDFRPLTITNGQCYQPVHTTIPAQVTDNNLYFALRRITDHTQPGADEFPVSIMSAFSITPSAGNAHLAIQPTVSPSLTISQTVQFYAIGWYMSNSVTWSVDSGPGEIDGTGRYSAPSTATYGYATVRATSTVDPSQSATLRINLAITGLTFTSQYAGSSSQAGLFRRGSQFLLDGAGNKIVGGNGDYVYNNFLASFQTGDKPVAGDWNGNGITKIGIYRPSTGTWFLDTNGNGIFDVGDQTFQFGGVAGDIPVVGDWSGTGTAKIGLVRPFTPGGQAALWILDYNGNGSIDSGDQVFGYGGITGDIPVVGDWNGDGRTKVGMVRPFSPGGVAALWILDANNDHTIDSGDLIFGYGGLAGDVPIVGDWNGSGTSKAGTFRQGFLWIMDDDGSAPTTLGGANNVVFAYGGIAGDVPLTGHWK